MEVLKGVRDPGGRPQYYILTILDELFKENPHLRGKFKVFLCGQWKERARERESERARERESERARERE